MRGEYAYGGRSSDAEGLHCLNHLLQRPQLNFPLFIRQKRLVDYGDSQRAVLGVFY
jgi:hypothetical protein